MLHTMYDMPWLGAVLRKLSQTQCLTLSAPSHQTGRNLSRLQFKNWTTEEFHCDFWKLSLHHSPPSPAAPKAQAGPHVHITNTSSPRPSSPAQQHSFLGLGREHWQWHGAGQEWHWGRALLSSEHWDSLMSPQMLTFFGAGGRRNVTAIPALEHKPGIIIYPAPALTEPQLSFLCTCARRLSWRMEKEELGQLLIFFER